jgi:hypothetical protein
VGLDFKLFDFHTILQLFLLVPLRREIRKEWKPCSSAHVVLVLFNNLFQFLKHLATGAAVPLLQMLLVHGRSEGGVG